MRHSFAAAILCLAFWCTAGTTIARANQPDVYDSLNLFVTILDHVQKNYVEEVDQNELIGNAIRGLLASLDPHSSFIDPESYGEFEEQTRGTFGGIGIEITVEEGLVKIVSPIEGTPGDKAGLMPGDFITHVNGESLFGLTVQESVDLLRGEIGSEALLTIVRDRGDPFEVSVIRDTITIRTVRNRLIEDVGYIRIATFGGELSKQLRKSIDDIKEEAGDTPLRGYVLDLRNNPGGRLDQAILVTDAFLERGEIVSTRGRTTDSVDRYNAKPGDWTDGLPVVVLVNNGSASASEIVAGALQDHSRAIIVGTRTFGKGSVQAVSSFGEDGALRLTISRYYTPSGRSIQGLGVEPDVILPRIPPPEAEEVAENPEDGRVSEADLRGSLEGGLTEDEREAEEDATRERTRRAAELRRDDNQLAYAVDLLRGISLYR